MKIKSLHLASIEEFEYQKAIYDGTIIPSTSGYRCIDDSLLGGFNDTDICLFAALSGIGKSTFVNTIGFNIATLNKNCRTLLFSFEVPGRKVAAKLISKNISKSLEEMYKGSELISKEYFTQFKDIPFDIVEIPLNIDSIDQVINYYCNKYPNDRIHVIIDHTLLVKDRPGSNDMETLKEISNYCNETKKKYKIVFLIVSQLNNSMLDPKRLSIPNGQYPNQTDIFGSKYLYHVSNNVFCLVNPNSLNLPGNTYGIHKLPLKTSSKDSNITKEYVYLHKIKTRDSVIGIDPLINYLEYGVLREFKKEANINFKLKYKL